MHPSLRLAGQSMSVLTWHNLLPSYIFFPPKMSGLFTKKFTSLQLTAVEWLHVFLKTLKNDVHDVYQFKELVGKSVKKYFTICLVRILNLWFVFCFLTDYLPKDSWYVICSTWGHLCLLPYHTKNWDSWCPAENMCMCVSIHVCFNVLFCNICDTKCYDILRSLIIVNGYICNCVWHVIVDIC